MNANNGVAKKISRGDNIMFICYECGHTFYEPKHWEEKHGLDYPPYENVSGCPYCGGSFTEAYRCDACGEWIDTDTYVEIGDEKYCENCFTIKSLGD